MTRGMLVASMLLFGSSPGSLLWAQSTQPAGFEQALKSARDYPIQWYTPGDFEHAVALFEQVMATYPEHPKMVEAKYGLFKILAMSDRDQYLSRAHGLIQEIIQNTDAATPLGCSARLDMVAFQVDKARHQGFEDLPSAWAALRELEKVWGEKSVARANIVEHQAMLLSRENKNEEALAALISYFRETYTWPDEFWVQMKKETPKQYLAFHLAFVELNNQAVAAIAASSSPETSRLLRSAPPGFTSKPLIADAWKAYEERYRKDQISSSMPATQPIPLPVILFGSQPDRIHLDEPQSKIIPEKERPGVPSTINAVDNSANITMDGVIVGIKTRAQTLSSLTMKLSLSGYWQKQSEPSSDGKLSSVPEPISLKASFDFKVKGQKIRMEHTSWEEGSDTPSTINHCAWDGRRCLAYSSDFPKDSVKPGTGGIIRPEPSQSFYACYSMNILEKGVFDFEGTLDSIVDKQTWTLRPPEKVADTMAVLIEGPVPQLGGQLKVWLDPRRDFAPLRMQIRIPFPTGHDITEELTDIELMQCDGTWVMKHARLLVCNPDVMPGGIYVYDFTVEKAAVAPDLPDGLFTLTFPPGIGVLDTGSNVVFRVRKDGTLEPIYFAGQGASLLRRVKALVIYHYLRCIFIGESLFGRVKGLLADVLRNSDHPGPVSFPASLPASVPHSAASQPAPASAPAGPPVATQRLFFGPVLAQIVTDSFNFDTGQLLAPPPDFRKDAKQESMAAIKWELHADVNAEARPDGLMTYAMTIVPLTNGDWAAISASDLLSRLRAAATNNHSPVSMKVPAGDRLPVTCGFWTPGGRMGVLQIMGFTDHPFGVKIRYKLVQGLLFSQPPASSPWTARSTAKGAYRWPPKVQEDWLAGLWMWRSTTKPAPGEVQSHLVLLNPDKTWADLTVWGDLEKPALVQVDLHGARWELRDNGTVRPSLILTKGVEETTVQGEGTLTHITGSMLSFSLWMGGVVITNPYERCGPAALDAIGKVLAGSGVTVGQMPAAPSVDWPGRPDTKLMTGVWVSGHYTSDNEYAFLVTKADGGWGLGRLSGGTENPTRIVLDRQGPAWRLSGGGKDHGTYNALFEQAPLPGNSAAGWWMVEIQGLTPDEMDLRPRGIFYRASPEMAARLTAAIASLPAAQSAPASAPASQTTAGN